MHDHRRGVPTRYAQAVRELDGDYYMRAEVAQTLDVSAGTLKTWADADPKLGPHGYVIVDDRRIYLYTAADLVALRAHLEAKYPIRANGLRTRRRGRPKLWSRDELVDRRYRQRREHYLRCKAARVAEQGRTELAQDCIAAANEVRAELDREYLERFAWATGPRYHGDD